MENYYLSLDRRRSGAGLLEIRLGKASLKSRRSRDDARLFSSLSPSLFYFGPAFSFRRLAALLFSLISSEASFRLLATCLSVPIECLIVPLIPGRLKVIALASAVGVSAGLITLTVAIMIR